jgi:hypothetical protein
LDHRVDRPLTMPSLERFRPRANGRIVRPAGAQ